MSQTANITVYLQAIGGHFLGANAYDPANISIQFSYSGGTLHLPYPITTNFTDDGNVSPYFTTGASSFLPIITIPQPAPAAPVATLNYLSADFTTIAAKANILLPDSIEFADLAVSIPTTSGKPLLLKQQVILNPMQPDYKIIMGIPGLYLLPAEMTGNIAVFVRMMCGCPVTAGPPASLWPSNDFTVFANLVDISGNSTPYLLHYDSTQTGNSLFTALLPANQAKIRSVTFSAFQKSTGNYGVTTWNAC
jgi:hypothetical protein